MCPILMRTHINVFVKLSPIDLLVSVFYGSKITMRTVHEFYVSAYRQTVTQLREYVCLRQRA